MGRLGTFLAAPFLLLAGQAQALNVNSELFCAAYPSAGACVTGLAPCSTCHAGNPPALNAFGADVRRVIATRPDYSGTRADFEQHLSGVLAEVEALDSDADGFGNRDEIDLGHGPGDALDVPSDADQGTFDPMISLRRLSAIYCGSSPTFEQNQALASTTDKLAFLHAALDVCLRSDHWLKEALPRLADEKVRPVSSLGTSGDPFVLADYDYDYRLFVHALSGNRDARDLLLADYHVAADGTVVRGVIPDRDIPGRFVVGNGQPLQRDRRAGMITTQWFIVFNTMFAVLPRNTAAHAYRSYLGLDIARSEGLHPIDGEPRDVDGMRVAALDCTVCHSTLDPLAYPFSPYVALGKGPTGMRPRRAPVGSYDANARIWEGDGYLMGDPVDDLMDWARKAANSDAFKINLAKILFRHALGREPATSLERSELEALWRSVAGDGYSANRLIHRLVETRSFGAPGPVTAPNALWKRHKAVARDLQRALILDAATVCREFGLFDCVEDVFLTPLGGNDPFVKGQYRPVAAPTVTTPIALERVVLGACGERVERDVRSTPEVFRSFDLTRASLVGELEGVDATTVDLYRRLLGRDPTDGEIVVARELVVDDAGAPVPARDVAKLLCFAVGTTREFAFQ